MKEIVEDIRVWSTWVPFGKYRLDKPSDLVQDLGRGQMEIVTIAPNIGDGQTVIMQSLDPQPDQPISVEEFKILAVLSSGESFYYPLEGFISDSEPTRRYPRLARITQK